MKISTIRTRLPIVLSVVAMSAATTYAQFVDFETLPPSQSGGTPMDDQALTGSYSGVITTVTFGFDTTGDCEIDVDARFEERYNKAAPLAGAGNDLPCAAYTALGVPPFNPDQDLTGTGEGGRFLLREPKAVCNEPTARLADGDAFLVIYTPPPDGTLPTSASGQVWDIDAGEKFKIEALASDCTVIATDPNTPVGDGTSPAPPGGPLNGLPYTFKFANLTPPIAKIRITLTFPDVRLGGGFAFDNFNATGVGPRPPTIPTVSAWGLIVLTLLVAVGAKLYFGRRHPEPTE